MERNGHVWLCTWWYLRSFSRCPCLAVIHFIARMCVVCVRVGTVHVHKYTFYRTVLNAHSYLIAVWAMFQIFDLPSGQMGESETGQVKAYVRQRCRQPKWWKPTTIGNCVHSKNLILLLLLLLLFRIQKSLVARINVLFFRAVCVVFSGSSHCIVFQSV